MTQEANPAVQLDLNNSQQEALLDGSNIVVVESGRGTGKTTVMQAVKLLLNANAMPGGKTALVAETERQALTRTMPVMLKGFAMMGLERGKHYEFGRKPPKSFDLPFEAPLEWSNMLTFCNGHALPIITQARSGTSNSHNLDAIVADEAKYLDYQQLSEETMVAMRANTSLWGHMAIHQSMFFTTSKATSLDAAWIAEMASKVDSKKTAILHALIHEILRLQALLQEKLSNFQENNILKQLSHWEVQANWLRKNNIAYYAHDSFTNLKHLGIDYFRRLYRNLPAALWTIEILNQALAQVEHVFYPALSRHNLYTDRGRDLRFEDFSFDESNLSQENATLDSDYNPNMPLYLGVDWGARLNGAAAGQLHQDPFELRFIRNFYVEHPQTLDNLANNIIQYYSKHGYKHLYLSYDPSGNKAQANSAYTYAQQFANHFIDAKWRVSFLTEGGGYPSHQDKYLLWHRLLSDELPVITRFNRHGCRELLLSMNYAPAKEGSRGDIQKDKSSEKPNSQVPQYEATHLSDAADYLVADLFMHYLTGSQDNYLPTM